MVKVGADCLQLQHTAV